MATTKTPEEALPSGALHPIARSRLVGDARRPMFADRVSVGVIVWLSSELMFFAALFAAYFTIRNVTNGVALRDGTEPLFLWGHGMLNITFAAINTGILILSSVTCQIGVNKAEHGQLRRTGSLAAVGKWGMREWYTLTFIMGSVFVAGQIYEYFALFSEGVTISSNVYGSVFFLATGFHGLHVAGGLVAFLLLIGRTYMTRKFTREQMVNSIVVSYYWHFVDVIWVVLFAVIYLLEFV